MQIFNVLIDFQLNELLNKQSFAGDLMRHWVHVKKM